MGTNPSQYEDLYKISNQQGMRIDFLLGFNTEPMESQDLDFVDEILQNGKVTITQGYLT